MAYNNVYVAEGPRGRVLVDTGPDYLGARPLLDSELPALPDRIVATHGHHDHAGLGRWWQARGAPVAIGHADFALAARPHFTETGEIEAMRAWVAGTGAPEDVQAEAIAGLERRRLWSQKIVESDAYPPPGSSPHWPTGLRYEPFEAAIRLSDGDQAGDLGVLHCPGHTPGNLVLIDEAHGWLFSGDQLLPDITPTPGIQFVRATDGTWIRFPSLPAFVASLRRLAVIRFERCYPGHGEPFGEVAAAIASNLSAIEQRDERVYAELRSGGPAHLYRLCERMYPKALRRRFWQIAATVQGHLDVLAAVGRVRQAGEAYEAVPA